MDRLANAVILSWGWRRRGIASAAGALSALAMPPFFIFPILWLVPSLHGVVAIYMKREDRKHQEVVDAIRRHGPPPGYKP